MPIGIASNILQCEPNLGKWEGYAVNLEFDNFKNELHQAVNAASQDDSGGLSGCFYIDADNAREHPTTKLVTVLTNHKNLGTLIYPTSKAPVFSYQTQGYITPLIDRENPDYFMVAFPTLFSF